MIMYTCLRTVIRDASLHVEKYSLNSLHRSFLFFIPFNSLRFICGKKNLFRVQINESVTIVFIILYDRQKQYKRQYAGRNGR